MFSPHEPPVAFQSTYWYLKSSESDQRVGVASRFQVLLGSDTGVFVGQCNNDWAKLPGPMATLWLREM